MRKIIVIAAREYQAAVKTKAFLVSLIAMPLMMGGVFIAQVVLKDQVDITDRRIAILDQTGEVYDTIAEAAEQRNEKEIFEGDSESKVQTRPRFVIEEVTPSSDDLKQLVFELSERVRDNKLFAFLTIGADVVTPDENSTDAGVAYYSNNPTYDNARRWLRGLLNDRVHALRFEATGLDPNTVRKATQHVRVTNLGLVSVDEEGKITEAQETNEVASFLIPFGLLMLMFMVVMVGAAPLVQSVLEEKMQRIAEVLLGSVPPFQLMLGKLLGMVGVSLTIGTLYLSGSYYALHRTGFDEFFPTHLVWWFVAFQALAVTMFGSIFIAIGAAVSDLKESQSIMTPVMVVVVAPMFVWMNVLQEPNATSSVLMSLFPPATPMLMILRLAVPPGVPLWQVLLGMGLVIITTLVCVFAASRIFRVGILMQGKGAKISEMLRWVFRG